MNFVVQTQQQTRTYDVLFCLEYFVDLSGSGLILKSERS